MRHRHVARFVALLLAAVAGFRSALAQDAPATLAGRLESIRAAHAVPALGVLLMDGERVVASAVVGVRAVGSPERATLDDQWHLGSCTKAMTATLAARLVERGTITWETTVAEVFPAIKASMTPGWEKITLRHLVTNTAGVPADIMKDEAWGSLWNGTRAGTPPRDQRVALLARLVTLPLDHVPGTASKYSNQNFIVAGHMLETVADTAWEALVTKEVFTPLGITTGGFGAPGSKDTIDQPRGHRGKDGAWTPVEPGIGADNPTGLGPAGTARMTLADWGRFVSAHARGERATVLVEGKPFLSPESLRLLHTPQIPNRDGEGYAMGWALTHRPWGKGDSAEDEGRVLTHAGSNTMWYCVAWVSVERGITVVATTNCGGPTAQRATDEAVGAAMQELSKGAKP